MNINRSSENMDISPVLSPIVRAENRKVFSFDDTPKDVPLITPGRSFYQATKKRPGTISLS
jgi:hypothetical protein